MKTFKRISHIILLSIIMFGFSNCSSSQKLQKETPFTIKDAYSQDWVAGVEGGGSGINVFLSIAELGNKVELDSLYFHGEKVKLEEKNGLYIGRYKTKANEKRDLIIHEDPKKEYGNKPPIDVKEKIPFNLEDTEAVVSYVHNGVTKYFKIENIKKKESVNYPSIRQNP
ncbi:hypothetical protein GWK08_07180 [Leptobacterium flavescens]|uniref:Lipoprotein n=1 Tax=Leptobacterium flavescens TaxID=472055 RepID=A0A6P0US60_9FLAO|nr:hypothetical protein [Leptobacterium flavescens]NER13216.1 hypothetical protein [Leptobacterium flavescens]